MATYQVTTTYEDYEIVADTIDVSPSYVTFIRNEPEGRGRTKVAVVSCQYLLAVILKYD